MSYSEDTIDFLHQGDLIGMQNSLAKACIIFSLMKVKKFMIKLCQKIRKQLIT